MWRPFAVAGFAEAGREWPPFLRERWSRTSLEASNAPNDANFQKKIAASNISLAVSYQDV
jgi:hypothetical protein